MVSEQRVRSLSKRPHRCLLLVAALLFSGCDALQELPGLDFQVAWADADADVTVVQGQARTAFRGVVDGCREPRLFLDNSHGGGLDRRIELETARVEEGEFEGTASWSLLIQGVPEILCVPNRGEMIASVKLGASCLDDQRSLLAFESRTLRSQCLP